MKLELDAETLQRIIDGDSGLEASLREDFVEAFVEKLAKTASFETAVARAKRLINDAAKQALDVQDLATSHLWPSAGQRLIQLIEQLVKERAQLAVDDVLNKTIEYQKSYWGREIKKVVDKAIESGIEKAVEEGIRSRLDRARSLGESNVPGN